MRWVSIVVLVAAWLSVLVSASHHLRHAQFGVRNESLCGEQLKRQTGFLNGFYYVFYESAEMHPTQVDHEIPVVLWLAGGPGCSGLIATLFELGPCMFDDETTEMHRNPFAWTNIAHVLFVDQPHGTGFSDSMPSLLRDPQAQWSESKATAELAGFVDKFFDKNPQFQNNDFYIIGESFAGHYVPDLGAYILRHDASGVWRRRLKGIGIGNGVTSPVAHLQTYLEFAQTNQYANDLLGNRLGLMEQIRDQALEALQSCREQLPNRRYIDGAEVPQVCVDGAGYTSQFTEEALMGVLSAGHNMYDVRRDCHREDPLGLCYAFSELVGYVNQPHVLEYLGVTQRTWTLCSMDILTKLQLIDEIEESEDNVAFLLEEGVRVLVYAGDADSMAPWVMQKRWTHDLEWSFQSEFRASEVVSLTLKGNVVGTVQTSHGLSLVRVLNAGHMVPHDQPEVALEMVRNFLYGDRRTGVFA